MLPEEVRSILRRLNENGYEAYAVGGCVRDGLLGRAPQDWDLTTSARPEQVAALFPGRCIPTGLQHGTVTVRQGGRSFEVTTFRSDGVYSDHRHPDQVTFSASLSEDLARRDFTIGAMAMDAEGNVTDLWGGQEDLRRGVIRCVGEADRRFEEDALRIMRALRFASVLGFAIEPETAAALRRKAPLLRAIAAERIAAEMDRLLLGEHVLEVLLAYPDVLGVFLPEVLPAVGFDQRNPHHCYDVWGHTAHAVAEGAPERAVRWALLFHDLGKPNCFTVDEAGVGHFYGHGKVSCDLARAAMGRLKFDTATRERVALLVDWHDRVVPNTHRSYRRVLNALGAEAAGQLLEVKRADNLAQAPACRGRQKELDRAREILDELLAQDACFSLSQLAVKGQDVLALGLRGPAVGRVLQRLLNDVVEERLPNDRAALLERAARYAAEER